MVTSSTIFFEAEKQYLLALENTNEDNQKRNIYLELLKISESKKDYSKSLEYIYGATLYSQENPSTELLDKWFDYNRQEKQYSLVYDEIDLLTLISMAPLAKVLEHFCQKGSPSHCMGTPMIT